jgi:5-formyltetrahydrofolate cyclo-ligase
MHDEVRTEEILQDLFAQGKTCFIPKYQSTASNHMDMLRLHSMQDMETLPLTSWNIKQPSDDDFTREEALATGAHLDTHLDTPGAGDRTSNLQVTK